MGGTVWGGAEPVREVVERYRETADAGAVKGKTGAGDMHSGGNGG